jgi:hypothetical protein
VGRHRLSGVLAVQALGQRQLGGALPFDREKLVHQGGRGAAARIRIQHHQPQGSRDNTLASQAVRQPRSSSAFYLWPETVTVVDGRPT